MAKKKNYEIQINANLKVEDPFVYSFGSTKDIKIHIGHNKASICWTAGSKKKTHEDLIPCTDRLVRDAFRKVFLLHALMEDTDLKIRKVTTVIDGDKRKHGKDNNGVPFIYSMISKEPMKLTEGWRKREFLDWVASKNKSSGKEDHINICIHAFLASKGREYEIDRFSNLWTAMNSYYTWFAQISNQNLRQQFLLDHENKKKYIEVQNSADREQISINWDNTVKQLAEIPEQKDKACINWLIKSIDANSQMIERQQFQSNKEFRSIRYRFGSQFFKMTESELAEIYEYSVELLHGREIKDSDPWAEWARLSENLGQKLYFFLVFDYPYYCRCNYIHGSAPLLLLEYENEKEVKELFAAGYFVERFLENRIPGMYKAEDWVPSNILENHMTAQPENTRMLLEQHRRRTAGALGIPCPQFAQYIRPPKKLPYNFWGWRNAVIKAVNSDYKGINTPRDLYDALSHIWSADTCAPRLRSGWTPVNKTLGQCSITAFLAQDIFGGEVYGILRDGGNYHCYNQIGDCKFDLTSEQFQGEVLDYENNPLQSRETHFAKEEKKQRYEALKAALKAYTEGKQQENV